MVFNSFKFILFFISIISFYFFIPFRFKKYFLLAASYFFYMSWKAEYGLLLLLSTSIQYYCGIQIEKHKLNSTVSKRFMLSLIHI